MRDHSRRISSALNLSFRNSHRCVTYVKTASDTLERLQNAMHWCGVVCFVYIIWCICKQVIFSDDNYQPESHTLYFIGMIFPYTIDI